MLIKGGFLSFPFSSPLLSLVRSSFSFILLCSTFLALPFSPFSLFSFPRLTGVQEYHPQKYSEIKLLLFEYIIFDIKN